MSLKKLFAKRVLFITTFFSLNTLAQECPSLPKNGFPASYHESRMNFKELDFTAADFTLSRENQIDLQKESELKQYFNRVLWDMKQAKCVPNKVLTNKIFLFQTQESLKDSLGYRTSIQNKHEHIPFGATQRISAVYGGVYQRDVSIIADSIRISNWYIRHFLSNELEEIIQERKKLAFLSDSLNLEIEKLEGNHQDWRIRDAQITPMRKQRIPLKAWTDSLDFLLYPSLLPKLKSWYEQAFGTVLNPHYNPEAYLGPRGYNQKEVIIDSDTDPFLEKKFRLHHVFDTNPYFTKTISMGDSSTLQGLEIYRAKYVRDDYSPWREGRFSYSSLNEKYLIVLKQESNIGETFWDYKNTYYIYEAVE